MQAKSAPAPGSAAPVRDLHDFIIRKNMKAAIIGYGKMGREIEKILLERGHSVALVIDTDNASDLNAANLAQAKFADGEILQSAHGLHAVQYVVRHFYATEQVAFGACFL